MRPKDSLQASAGGAGESLAAATAQSMPLARRTFLAASGGAAVVAGFAAWPAQASPVSAFRRHATDDAKRQMGRKGWLPLIGLWILAATHQAEAAGDSEAGERAFRACAACHTLEPGAHRTGPSLAGVFGRKAGTAAGFHRYSEALRSVDLAWGEDTLDAFLADPQGFLPGNRMTFPGIEDEQTRADLLAYLQTATAEGAQTEADGPPAEPSQRGMMGGGMMGTPGDLADLKNLGPGQQVTAIRYCGDTYHVTTAAGEAVPFWEFNLRFKTDSSDQGPRAGKPVLLPASMMGDRAFVIFAAPEEISALIEAKC